MPDAEMSPEELAKLRGDYVEEEETDEEEVQPEEEEASAESESEPEEEEVAEVEEEDQPGDEVEEEKPITIPKARFDEANRKAREREAELNRRIEELESKSKTEIEKTDTNKMAEELNELSDKYEQALLDGEVEKARQFRIQRDQKQNDLYDMKLAQQSQQASQSAIEQMRYDAQLAQLEAKHPAINPDSDEFNEKIAAEVSDMIQVFQTSGYKLTAALQKAVHYVVRDEPTAASDDPDIVRTKRSQDARKRVAKAAKQSPPDLADKGRDSDKAGTDDGLPDITKMSPEQFEKLTAEQIRKLRGDSISDEVA